ncbi:MAG: hypothetical protein ACK5NX_01235 [Armatimonadota bacterium]
MTPAERVKKLQSVVDNALASGIDPDIVEEGLAQEGYTLSSLSQAVQRVNSLGGSAPAEVGFGGRALNSALFNFGDEIAGRYRASRMSELPGLAGGFGTLVDRAFGFDAPAEEGTTYDREVAAARMGQDEYARQYPGRALAADVTGAAVPALATFGAAAPSIAGRTSPAAIAAANAARTAPAVPSLVGQAARAGGVGMAQGALGGFGAGEGGAAEQALSTATGAAFGLGFGAGIPLATRGGQAATGLVGRTAVGRGVRNAASAVTGGMIRNADEYATQRARQEGLQKFSEMVASGNASLDDFREAIVRLEALGIDDSILADIAGPAMRSNMRGAANLNAEVRGNVAAMLDQRAARQGDRVRDVLENATGERPGQRSAFNARTWQEALNQEADPLLNSALRPPGGSPYVGDDPRIAALFQNQSGAVPEALRRTLAIDAQRTAPQFPGQGPFTNPLNPQQRSIIMNANLAENTRETLGTMQQSAANNLVGEGADPQRARALGEAYGEFSSALRGVLPPSYGVGLDTRAAGYTADEFAGLGREFLDAKGNRPAEILAEVAKREADQMAGLPPALRPNPVGPAQFREGVMDSINERILGRERLGAGEGGRVDQVVPSVSDALTSRGLRDVFPRLNDPAVAERYGQQLGALTQQSQTRNAFLGGQNRVSVLDPTDPAFTGGQASSVLQNANFLPFFTAKAAEAINKGQKTAQAEAVNAIGDVWTRQGSRQLNPFFDEVARQRIAAEQAGRLAEAVGSGLGGAAGSATGRAVGDKDTSVGPARADVLRGIEQRQRLIEDPNTPPAERENLIRQQARMRALIGQ